MTDHKSELLAKLRGSDARVAIVGLGYVGLPLAVAFADAGFGVVGIDLDSARIARVSRGDSYIADVSSVDLERLVSEQRLVGTVDYSDIETCDAVSICVPTPLNKQGTPDISHIIAATEEVARHARPRMVFVLESTTYPGTTTEVVQPLLESRPGLEVGENIFLAFSPERVDPGRTDWNIRTTPRVIGGSTQACLEVALAYYGRAIETLVPVSSTATAEMTKLLENTFRAINIGLANEVLLMCDTLGLNAWEVIEAAATKPFGFMKFSPGPGLGGHCIPVDPLYLSWRMKQAHSSARFIELANEINSSMPRYWVHKVQDALNDAGKPLNGSDVLVVGAAYKKDTDDLRESPALDIIHLLTDKGASVQYHDPHVPAIDQDGIRLCSVVDLDEALSSSDCVVLVTDHSAYDYARMESRASRIVDTRNAIGGQR